MSSKIDEKASSTSSSAAANNNTNMNTTKSDDVVPSAASRNGTDEHDDDGDDLLYADLAALSIQPTLSSSSSSPTSSSWHLWRYSCRDFPVHGCPHPPTCEYCTEVNNLQNVYPNAKDESPKRWSSYFERCRAFDDLQSALEFLKTDSEGMLPSKLAQKVFFNRKLGTAFFRAGFSPVAENNPEIRFGGSDQLRLFASTGHSSRQFVKNLDAIFMHTIRLISELPEAVQNCINGVFCQCEINPWKYAPNQLTDKRGYRDHADLPFMAKLEVWIGDVKDRFLVRRELSFKVEAELKKLGVPVPGKAVIPFHFFYFTKYSSASN